MAMSKKKFSEVAIIGVGHIGLGVTHAVAFASLKNQRVIVVDDMNFAQKSELNFAENPPIVMAIKPHKMPSDTFKAADSLKIKEPKNYINGKTLPRRNKKKK